MMLALKIQKLWNIVMLYMDPIRWCNHVCLVNISCRRCDGPSKLYKLYSQHLYTKRCTKRKPRIQKRYRYQAKPSKTIVIGWKHFKRMLFLPWLKNAISTSLTVSKFDYLVKLWSSWKLGITTAFKIIKNYEVMLFGPSHQLLLR